jgi:hypothetical protein
MVLMARFRVRFCSATQGREVRVLGLGQFAVQHSRLSSRSHRASLSLLC